MLRKIGFALMVLFIVGLAIGLMGCDVTDPLTSNNADGPIGAIGAPQGDNTYNTYRIDFNDGFPYDRIPDAATLAILNNGEIVKAAPMSIPEIWYKTNAVIKSGKTGFEEGTGTSVSGKITFTLMPNRFVVESGQSGYDNYWIISRKNSSSGDFYYWLKLSDGTMPQYADAEGKTYFKMSDAGVVVWVNQGNQILNHKIVLENVGLGSNTVYVKGDKSTLGQWLSMDYVNTTMRQLSVNSSSGRETLEFKDNSGHKYRYKVTVDNAVISYGDPSRDYMPTFDYTSSGISNLGNNLSYSVGITVADSDGGGIPPVVSQDGNIMRIEGTNLIIKLAALKDANSNSATNSDQFYLFGSMPGTGWTWAERSANFQGTVSGTWVMFSLLNFPQGNSVCNIAWGPDRWLLWTLDGIKDSGLWVTTDQGGKAIGIRRSGNTFSKI